MIDKVLLFAALLIQGSNHLLAEEFSTKITGNEVGWRALQKADSVRVNSNPDTWAFDDAKAEIACTGNNASPNNGHICLESEGTPILCHNLKIRELP